MIGHTNNPNGRPKAVPNKVTTEIRKAITDSVSEYLYSQQFKQDFDALNPRDRLKCVSDLLSYTLPKMQAIDLNNSERADGTSFADELKRLVGSEN